MKTKILFLLAYFTLTFGWGQAFLPVTRTTWDATPTGWTDSPLDSYTTSFACSTNNGAKFDTTGDSKTVNINATPDQLTFVVKSNATTTSSLHVEQSDDGITYATIVNLSTTTDLPTTCTTKGPYTLNATTRYVRWTFTKGSQNMTMDDVSITSLSATSTITTSAISGSPFCVGNTITATVNVPFTISGTYNAGNVFTAQLSDATGSFASPTVIGSLTQTTAGTIAATIPASIPAGTGYRIRVVGDNPATTGTPNSVNLTINNFAAPTSLVSTCGNANSSSTWTNPGCFDQVILVAKAGAFTAALPIGDGTAYTANLAFGSGTAFDGGFVVFKGIGTASGTITGLTNGTLYSFKIFVRKGTTWLAGGTQTCTPAIPPSAASDLVITGVSPATISSLINNNAPLTSVTGIEVLRFILRDGGATNDTDTLPTTLTAFTIAQSATNNVGTWSDAINTIELFDGTTRIAAGTVSATQIQFSGLNITASDDDHTSKVLSLRMSLKCPLGADAFDGEDFGFSIANTNVTFDPSGSNKTTFTAVVNPNNTNVINVISTQLLFGTQPTTTSVGSSMGVSVTVKATDSCGNVDTNYTSAISITSSGTMTGEPISINAVAGVSTYIGLTHTVDGLGLTLTATSGSLTLATSNPFNITIATQFTKGDFAVLGLNSNVASCTPAPSGYSNGDDEVSFITFKDIQNGDYFYMTDNGYERANTSQWGDTEGVYQITRNGSTIPAGTVITFRFLNNTPFVEFNSPDANWVFTKAPGFTGSLVLNTNGDQLFFMQGGSWSNPGAAHDAVYTPGTFLFAFNTNTSWTSFANSTQQSGLPLELRCFSMLPGAATDFIEYTGPVTPASKTDWISRINDPLNWTNRLNCDGYTRMHVGQTYLLSVGTPLLPGVWTGRDNTNWFDCGNWHNLEVPKATDDVNLNITYAASNIASIVSTAPGASDYGGIAKCNNLTIGAKEVQIISNSNNKLEVNGNLTINASGTLNMDDLVNGNPDGQIYLKGNWTNSRDETFFKEGEGTVHFNGTIAQTSTCAGGTPENYFNVNLANPVGFTTNSFTSDLIAKGSLTLSNGSDLTVKTGHYALAAKNLTIEANSILEIEDTASLSQTDDSGIVTNNGTINVNKKSTPYVQYDYTFWASPIVGETIGSVFSVNPTNYRFSYDTSKFLDIYSYKTIVGDTGFPQLQGVPDSFDDSGDDWILETGTNIVTPGKGYGVMGLAAAGATGQSVVFSNSAAAGRLNNGVIPVAVSQDLYNASGLNVSPAANAAHTNNNLIGNPYASAIDLNELKADNPILTGTFYFWTHKTAISTSNPGPWLYNFSNDDFVTYTVGTGGSASSCSGCPVPDRYVDSCQGFYANVTGNGSVTFNNSQRVAGNNNAFYRNASNINDKIWLNFNASTGESRQILVGFLEDAEDDYNPYYDGARLENGKNFDFFSFIPTNSDMRLAVQGLSSFDSGKIVPLGVEITQAGTHSISINNTEGVFENGQSIYLQDNLANATHDFENGPYIFQSEIGNAITNRFVLKFTNSSLGNESFDYTNSISVYSKDKQQVTINSLINKITEVTIFDILGREIVSKKNLKDNEINFTNLTISNQTLIVKIKLENGSIVTRKFII